MTIRSLLSLRNRIAPLGVFAATILALAPQAEAQCFIPDGYDSAPCCAPVTPTLPNFPSASLPGKGICWTDCVLSSEVCTKIGISAPVPSSLVCTQYTSDLEVFDCVAGTQLMKGTLTLDYTRTWTEQSPTSSIPIQIWRFAVKVDMKSPAGATLGCPTPLCAQVPGASAFYYGYVDYALDCTTGAFDTVLVLYHACDDFIHNAAFSAVPGTFHPTTTYAIVAPDTAANPFVPSIAIPSAGILANEAMRSVTPNATGTCHAEEHIQQGSFTPLGSGCLCPLSFASPQQTAVKVDGSGMCGGGFSTVNFFPVVPWYDLIITSIGRWSSPVSYPGPEHASVAEGLFQYRNVCSTTGVVEQSFDIFYGGYTIAGYPVIPTSPIFPPLSNRFLDIATNYSLLAGTPIAYPLYGAVAPTDHLIYVNP